VEERHRSARQLARELRVWLGEDIPRRRRRRAFAAWRIAGLALAGIAVTVAGLVLWLASAPEGDDLARVTAAGSSPPVAETAGASPRSVPIGIAAPAAADAADSEPSADAVVAAGPTRPGAKSGRPRKAAPPRTPPKAAAKPAAPLPRGVLQLAISPWGQVEVDGAPAGAAPPLSRLDLPAGRHTVVIRNADFAPFKTTVDVSADQPVVVKHRFGS
jgi:serine/threonine-protein kinase